MAHFVPGPDRFSAVNGAAPSYLPSPSATPTSPGHECAAAPAAVPLPLLTPPATIHLAAVSPHHHQYHQHQQHPPQRQHYRARTWDSDAPSHTLAPLPRPSPPPLPPPPLPRQSGTRTNGNDDDEDDEEDEDGPLARTFSTASLSALSAGTRGVAVDVAGHHLTRLRAALAGVLAPARSHGYYAHLMAAATSYEQWSAAAEALDVLTGKDAWKRDPKSDHYDWHLVQDRLAAMAEARTAGDLHRLILLLRTSLSRNLGNIGNPMLHGECNIGTKTLIDDYIAETVRCLDLICDSPQLPDRQRMEFFLNTRQSFGRTALLLSGGATLAMNHIGVVKALWECRLLPRIISGASGGSIIASFVCTHTEDDFERMLNPAYTRLDFFDDPTENSPLHILNRFLKSGVLYDVETLINTLKAMFGDITFQEAYNRTRRILNITVSSSTVYEMPRLLNYITSPNVYIWSAVAASCSVPYVFKPAPLLAKDRLGKSVHWNPSGHRWIDGSVESDLPMQKLAELFNVNHFVVCQVNPHVVPFLHKGLGKSMFRSACESVLSFSRNEFNLRCNQLRELGLLPEVLYRVQSIVSQKYLGDVTIIPDIDVVDFGNVMTNPTPKSMIASTIKGERATWPKVSIMQNHLAVEMALDEMLYRCRLRALTESMNMSIPVSVPGISIAPPDLHQQHPPSIPLFVRTQSSAAASSTTSGAPPLSATESGFYPNPPAAATAAFPLPRNLVPPGWGMRAARDHEFGGAAHAAKPRVKSAVSLSGMRGTWAVPLASSTGAGPSSTGSSGSGVRTSPSSGWRKKGSNSALSTSAAGSTGGAGAGSASMRTTFSRKSTGGSSRSRSPPNRHAASTRSPGITVGGSTRARTHRASASGSSIAAFVGAAAGNGVVASLDDLAMREIAADSAVTTAGPTPSSSFTGTSPRGSRPSSARSSRASSRHNSPTAGGPRTLDVVFAPPSPGQLPRVPSSLLAAAGLMSHDEDDGMDAADDTDAARAFGVVTTDDDDDDEFDADDRGLVMPMRSSSAIAQHLEGGTSDMSATPPARSSIWFAFGSPVTGVSLEDATAVLQRPLGGQREEQEVPPSPSPMRMANSIFE
ncbi:acyl transferase/acyl hydrolase/lysophospholipase [Blastocladiella britannica]|nr:acyl transferase/acyl hydrolase/lysophospholipase [Blastocladiella britannica]